MQYLLICLFILSSFLLSASGEFTGWGDTILHHVADSNKVLFLNTIYISKHIIMLLISAFVTVIMATTATKNIEITLMRFPTGMAHLYEILMDFINKEIVYPNIGENMQKHGLLWQ